MDIRQLKYFVAIAEEEQITRAAKKLHLAQPHLSRQLKLLEEELGVSLVERGNKKISLTEAGKLLKKKAEQIIELTDSTVNEIYDFNKGLFGTIKIGTVSSSGTSILNNKMMDFKILDLLNTGIIEIGIVRTPFDLTNYNSIGLPVEPMIAVMSSDLAWESKPIIGLNQLNNKPLIIYRRFEELILQLCRQENFEPRFICKNDDARTTLLWAETGLGIGIVPRSAIDLVKSQNLSYKEISNPLLHTQILGIWLKNRDLSPAAYNFLRFFEKNSL